MSLIRKHVAVLQAWACLAQSIYMASEAGHIYTLLSSCFYLVC